MRNRRLRLLIFAAAALVLVWCIVGIAYHFSGKTRMTAEKVREFTRSTDLAGLSPSSRDQDIGDLADRVNALPFDERLKWRRTDEWKKWFAEMTEAERRKFIAATLPTGFRQTLEAFSQLPTDQRKQFVADAIQLLREDGAGSINRTVADYGPNGPPPLSADLQAEVRTLGLAEFFASSSAETKAELAPLLEEMQRQLQSGRR